MCCSIISLCISINIQTGYVSTTGYSSNDISCGPVVSLVDCSLFFKGICDDIYEEHAVIFSHKRRKKKICLLISV